MTQYGSRAVIAAALLVSACSGAAESVVPAHERDAVGEPSSNAATFSITISMTAETADGLAEQGASIYGLKAVGATNLAGQPLAWFQTQTYSLTTTLSWVDEYQAYTSTDTAPASVAVHASASYDIATGQTLTVVDTTGTGTVSADGAEDAISILNQTTTPFGSGISQSGTSGAAPFCKFPLNGGNLLVLTPMDTVFLMVSTLSIAPGSVVETSSGPGVLIALSDANERAVSYDLDEGWSFGDATWGTSIPTGADLVPLLILQP